MSSITLQPEHGAVVGTVVASALVHHFWMGFKVVAARKKFGVKYPHLYAPEQHAHKTAFDCVQRAHQNCLENLPTFLSLLLTAGVRYPMAASVCGLIYLAGRVLYFQGYSTGDPQKRMRGSIMYFGTLGLLGMAVRWSAELLKPLF